PRVDRLASVDLDLDALGRPPRPCAEAQPRHRGDGRQGLPAEAEGVDPRQVLAARDLAGGVALECYPGVLWAHPRPVVRDRDRGAATLPHLQPDAPSPGVEGVLDQL